MAKKKADKFSKKAILKSVEDADKRLLEILLKDDELYSVIEATNLLNKWREEKIK